MKTLKSLNEFYKSADSFYHLFETRQMDSRQRYWLHKLNEGRHQKEEFQILMKDLFVKYFHVAPTKFKEHL